MLVAVDAAGVRHTASPTLTVEVFCPDCTRELLVRAPRKRVPHFAHRAGEKCLRAAARAERARARRARQRAARAAAAAQAEVDAGQGVLFAAPEPAAG